MALKQVKFSEVEVGEEFSVSSDHNGKGKFKINDRVYEEKVTHGYYSDDFVYVDRKITFGDLAPGDKFLFRDETYIKLSGFVKTVFTDYEANCFKIGPSLPYARMYDSTEVEKIS